jgi:hypothetical protein
MALKLVLDEKVPLVEFIGKLYGIDPQERLAPLVDALQMGVP